MTKLSIAQLGPHATPAEVRAVVASELGAFFASEINPQAGARDEACEVIPRAAFEYAAQIGLLNFLLPREVGGLGGSRRTFGLLLEHVGYFCDDPAFPSMVAMFADIPDAIYRTRRPALLERYVQPMARGQKFGTFAYTDHGDAVDLQTKVVRREGRFVLNGTKCLQTGGALCDVFVTYANDERGDMQVFLVDRNDPGVHLTPVSTLGLRSAGLTQLRLEDVALDEDRLLGGGAQRFLDSRRMFIVCPFVGAMQRLIEVCVRHLSSVVRDGRPLTQAQAVQARLGGMKAKQIASRAILHDALDRIGRGEIDEVISAAELTITEIAVEVGERALRLTGGRGDGQELPVQRMCRAFLAAITGQAAQEMLEIDLGVQAIAEVAVE